MKNKDILQNMQEEPARNLAEAAYHMKKFLTYMGQDVKREGLLNTPMRYTKFFNEITTPQEFKFTTFQNEGIDEMIVVSNIPFTSTCEHHIATFQGYGAIAYIPNKKIVGLSKLPRTLDFFSRRLQNQERITTQVAEFIQEKLKPKGVGVILTAQHSCMCVRGVKKHDTWTTTSKLLGCFKSDPACKQEFLTLTKK